MSLLKKENWWIWILLGIGSAGVSIFFLGALLDVFNRKAWYAKWYYWALGIILFFFPAVVMLAIFYIQTITSVCKKLKVPGAEIYALPYAWLICIIIPVIGWVLLIILLIYVHIWYLVKLYQGKGEKYLK